MRSVGRRAGPGNTESSLRSVEWENDETESEERRGEDIKLFRVRVFKCHSNPINPRNYVKSFHGMRV